MSLELKWLVSQLTENKWPAVLTIDYWLLFNKAEIIILWFQLSDVKKIKYFQESDYYLDQIRPFFLQT